MSTIPYVISEDVRLLLEPWAKEKGFILPDIDFFDDWRERFKSFLKRIFTNFICISENDLVDGISVLTNSVDLPLISLEGIYCQTSFRLDTTRIINKDGCDIGLAHRPGRDSITDQIKKLRKMGLAEVALVDDVIFSGDSMVEIINVLLKEGIKTSLVIAGIGITGGIKKVQSCGGQILCGFEFDTVIDEVCERDFFPGIPLSGRTLAGFNGKNIGVPYILPFGKIKQWASIPLEHQKSFSRFCLQQTIELFRTIEEKTGRQIRCYDLGRAVFSIPSDKTNFVEALSKIIIV